MVSEHRWYEKWLFRKVNSIKLLSATSVDTYFSSDSPTQCRFRIQVQQFVIYLSTPYTTWEVPNTRKTNSNKFVNASNNNVPVNQRWELTNKEVFKPTNNVTGSLNLGNMNQPAAILPFSH